MQKEIDKLKHENEILHKQKNILAQSFTIHESKSSLSKDKLHMMEESIHKEKEWNDKLISEIWKIRKFNES